MLDEHGAVLLVEELLLELLLVALSFDGELVEVAVGARVDDDDLLLDRERDVLPLLQDLDEALAALELARVALSRSDANCAKAAISRYCARSRRSVPATFFIALIWALPPTRLTPRCRR
jgi:hypothetical protein